MNDISCDELMKNRYNGKTTTENFSEQLFIDLISPSKLFIIYRQCWGRQTSFDPHTLSMSKKNGFMCIDFILIPTKKARDNGWNYGPVGVETKAFGVKTGPAYSQALDYRDCIWEFDEKLHPNFWINLKYIFVFPHDNDQSVVGVMASIESQQRIGHIFPYGHHGEKNIKFYIGQRLILNIDNDNNFIIHNVVCGEKSGSR